MATIRISELPLATSNEVGDDAQFVIATRGESKAMTIKEIRRKLSIWWSLLYWLNDKLYEYQRLYTEICKRSN